MKNVADIYALSPMQQLMLLHARTADSAHDVLFNQIVYQIDGRLKAEAYRQAWALMVERHEALRAIFVWQDGKAPLQIVREEVALPWADLDWSHLAAREQERQLDAYLAADRAASFDLLHAPLMRLALIQHGTDSYWLVWSSHHLVIDRWCIDILFDEVQAAYDAFCAGRTPVLPPAPRYRDYIAWLAAQDEEAAARYWQEALAGTEAGSLPMKTLAPGETPDLDSLRLLIDGHDWAALRRFAAENTLTPGTLVTAVWAAVLGAATDAADALFGMTVSGRPADLPQVARTVGSFINNVPLRVALNGTQPLAAWLQGVQELQLGLQPFEYASPAQIQRWSGFKSKGPLFETLLVLQAPVRTAVSEGLDVRLVRGGMQTGYPISLGAVPGEESLRLSFTYDAARIPVALVTQLADALRQVLVLLPEKAGATLADLMSDIDIPAIVAVDTQNTLSEEPAEWHYAPRRTAAELVLAELWAEALALPQVSVDERFFDLGGDSISSIQLLTLVEERLGTRLPVSILFSNPTVAQMAAEMGNAVEMEVDPVLVPIRRDGTRPPIFFTHGVYGGLMWLTNLAPLLSTDQPAYGLQAIGLQPDAQPDLTIEAMAARYLEAMQRVQPSGPYYLAGFCFGGVVAYEIARQLEQLGEETALLAIIDGFPPRAIQRKRPLYDPLRLQSIWQSVPYWVEGKSASGSWRIKERALAMLGTTVEEQPASLEGVERETQRQITKINEQAVEAYVPQPFGGQVTLFRARYLGVRHALLGQIDPQSGWRSIAAGGVAIRPVTGTHVGILTNPSVAGLAAQLNDALQMTMPIAQ